MTDSNISLSTQGGGATYSGPDSVNLFRAITLKSGILLYINSGGRIIPTRGATITRMLAMAGEYTGKRYKRSQQQAAVDDLTVWIEAMRSAIPTTVDGVAR